MKRVATKDNIRVPLSDQTNVINMKKSGKSNVKVVKNPGRKLNVENESSKRPKSKSRNAVTVENIKIKKTKPESVDESQLTNKEGKVLKVVLTDIQARKKELVNKRTIRPRSLCSCCIIDSKAKHTETFLNEGIDVVKNTNQNKILEDLNQEKNKCLQQKVVIGKRIFRSRSQFCPAEDSLDVAEKANSAQKELFNKRTIRPKSLCSCCIIDSKAKCTEKHINEGVDVVKNTNQTNILEDLSQEKNKCLQQKVVIGKRIFRSRSQFCPAEDSSDVAEKANSAQKERVNKRTIRPKSLCSCCIIDSKAKHTATHLNEGVDVVKNTNQIDPFSKTLKVVLTDFVVEKNMLQRRSKSLCKEKFASHKMKPNKRNRAVSQCLDTENIEIILPKKVDTIQKNQPPKAAKGKHTETHLNEGVDVKNTNQTKILEDLNQEKNKCLQQKVVIGKRISRSRSQFCPAEDSSDVAEKANSAQKELVNKRTIRPKSLCSCCIIDSKAKHTETHLNEGVDVVKNTNQIDPFSKALKVVLTDFVVEKNTLRRRSKSLCEEKLASQKMKPNKRNRTVSQCLDTENIEVILPKKVGTIQKNQLPKASKAKHTETHLNEGVDIVKNTNQIDIFGKALKVVLTDFAIEKNILRRRSKSLCEEKFASQKVKPNKRNRAVSQCLDTENIEVILPKKVGTIQKNQPPKATFCPDIEKGKEFHNLRRLQPKNYMEESILNCSADKPKEQSPGSDLKKKDTVPIYKKNWPEEQITRKEDLYEFTDFSRKAKRVTKNRRLHTSSILFDKDTYEILKKLEEKEAKVKKKIVRKKKKLEIEKSYGDIVNRIVANVKHKISEKNKNPITTTTTQNIKVIHINNFEEEMNVIIHSSAEVPSTIKKTVPEVPKNVDTRKIEEVTNATTTTVKKTLSVVPKNVTTRNVEQVTNTTITTRKSAVNGEALFSNHSNILNVSDIDPILLQSIGSCDNSVSKKDIDSCFGFDIPSVPVTSTPSKLVSKNPINILNNVVLRRGIENMDSPVVDFNVKRPNANSTMVQTKGLQRASNPWRPDWVNLRYNPHFVSLKANSLPRLDQDMVLDHSLVEEFENSCSTPRNRAETPVKKPSVQQSILNFVDSNIEQDKEVLQGSLYDYEAFNSPEKKATMKDKRRVQKIQRNILGDENDIVASTPAKRRPLADISNSSEETKEQNSQNVTYFGFDESSEYIRTKTPEKRKKNPKIESKENKEDNADKPSRFNINTLRSYTKKQRAKEKQVNFDQNKSISIYEASSEHDAAEVHLFEEPEEMLDNMPSVCVEGKRQRRKRHDSYDSDTSDCGKKRKKHKKTKLEIEQEEWIKSFNEMCCEIDKEELELE